MSKDKLLFPDKRITMSIRVPIDLLEKLEEDGTEYSVTPQQVIVSIARKYYGLAPYNNNK